MNKRAQRINGGALAMHHFQAAQNHHQKRRRVSQSAGLEQRPPVPLNLKTLFTPLRRIAFCLRKLIFQRAHKGGMKIGGRLHDGHLIQSRPDLPQTACLFAAVHAFGQVVLHADHESGIKRAGRII